MRLTKYSDASAHSWVLNAVDSLLLDIVFLHFLLVDRLEVAGQRFSLHGMHHWLVSLTLLGACSLDVEVLERSLVGSGHFEALSLVRAQPVEIVENGLETTFDQ